MPDSIGTTTRQRRAAKPRAGILESTPRTRKNFPAETASLDWACPAICAISGTGDEIARAGAMGFNALGLGADRAHAARNVCALAGGMRVILDLDITSIDPESVLPLEHPGWFVAGPSGPRFFYLAANDEAVDWWDARIAAWQEVGVKGFRALEAAAVPASVWARLIEAARGRDPEVRFFSDTAGAAPEAIAALAGAEFDYGFSSSCWWDFSAQWLDDDAARIDQLGPAIALTAPLNALWPADEQARRRALSLAATYGHGWQMPLGYELGETFDLTEEVTALNGLRARYPALQTAASARLVSSAGAAIAILVRHEDDAGFVFAANASLTKPAAAPASFFLARLGNSGSRLLEIDGEGGEITASSSMTLPPGGVRLCEVFLDKPITLKPVSQPDCDAPRIAIDGVSPKIDDGQFPVRRVVGEVLVVDANVIADGHDKLAAELLWRPVDEEAWRTAPMEFLGNDEWRGQFPLERLGRYVYAVAAWKDVYATFVDEVTKKHAAGVPTHLELQEGLLLMRETAKAGLNKTGKALKSLLKELDAADDDAKRARLLSDEAVALMREADLKKFRVQSGEVIVDAERLGARFANWYEIFPRSQSGDENRHGTFRDVITQLPRIAGMGFDVLYFPPIHPIGRTNRKGRNNTLTPAADDPGSPYAIGSAEGGHDAIHPELGTLADFHALRDAAASHGVELALDFAIQCAPDHPWLKEHPEWFDWRPDGSLRYAENPPKKYEDIVNVDFYTEGAKPSLWIALRDTVQFWVDQGVKLFRVDNPHTKPLPFWEWLIGDIRSRHPDTVFLAEAFTRPKLMYRLAKIGFSQSYTYFTWRNTKAELAEYLTELNTTAPKDFFRPHFFVNTPDINPVFLHDSGRPGFLIRAALAATLSGLWGVYNGFELCEAKPVAPGKEEYRDSEKYQLKAWDYDRPGNIVPEITRLNRIRRGNAALQTHLGIEFHNAFNDQVLYFSKTAPDGNVILAAISLDPFNTQVAGIEIPLWLFGLPDDGALKAEDLMRDFKFTWYGKNQSVTLHPDQPFCIWRINGG
jgi:starch synthase (maltosyl-transferring)